MCTDNKCHPKLNVIFDRRRPYREEWERQKVLFNNLKETVSAGRNPKEEYVLLVEHDPVYTLGFHGNEHNLLADENRLRLAGAECIRIERGGDITFHGPGQLVVYPIIYLKAHSLGVKSYIEMLEQTVIRVLASYGIKGERIDGATGVWIDKGSSQERKICAIGVKCSRFVTMHGLALNVNTDLSYFNLINPCGFVDKGVTSIAKELGHQVDFEEVANRFAEEFKSALESNS